MKPTHHQARSFRESLRCPACDYDITQTFADGLGACPECGRYLEYERVLRTVETMPLALRAMIVGAIVLTWIGSILAWHVAETSHPLAAALVVIPATIFYLGWVALERWLRTRAPARAAAGPTLGVLALCAVFGPATWLLTESFIGAMMAH